MLCVVERTTTRLAINQISRGNTKVVGNLMLVFLIWFLKRRITFMPCSLRGVQEGSPDVVTGMLQIFSIYVYALLDPGATLYFINTFVDRKFEILPDILNKP